MAVTQITNRTSAALYLPPPWNKVISPFASVLVNESASAVRAVLPAGAASIEENITRYNVADVLSNTAVDSAVGGDISGTLPNVTVAKLQGRTVSSNAPSAGNALVWSGTAWAPAAISVAMSGDVTGTNAASTVKSATLAPGESFSININDTATDVDAIRVRHNNSVGAAGDSASITFEGANDGGDPVVYARVQHNVVDPAEGAEYGAFVISCLENSVEKVLLNIFTDVSDGFFDRAIQFLPLAANERAVIHVPGDGVNVNELVAKLGTALGVFSVNINGVDQISCTATGLTFAPPVAVGVSVEASAALAVTSTTQGFLPPRMTTTQRDAIASPADGLIIYNTTTHKLNVRENGVWRVVTTT